MALASDADGFLTGGKPLDLGAALELWRAVRSDIASIKDLLRRDAAVPDTPDAPRETPQRQAVTSVAALPAGRAAGQGADAIARALEAVAGLAPRQAPESPAGVSPNRPAPESARTPERPFTGASAAGAAAGGDAKRTSALLGRMLVALGVQEDSLDKGLKRVVDAIEDLTDATKWAKGKEDGGLLDKLPGVLGKAGKLAGKVGGAAAKAGKGLLGKAGGLLKKIPIKGAGPLAAVLGAVGLAQDWDAADKDETLTDRGRKVRKGEATGKFGGLMAGSAAGAMAGAALGPVGILAGGLIGGAIGAWGGSKAGGALTDVVLAPEAPGTLPGPAQGASPGAAADMPAGESAPAQAPPQAPTQADRRASRGGERPRTQGEPVVPSSIERVMETGKGYNVVERADGSQVKQTGSRNWRNNNPGNIEYGDFAKSKGAIGTDGRFAIFPTKEAGRDAKSSLIFEGKNYRDKTLEQAIERYAPPSENDTKRYQSEVLKAAGGQNKRMADYTPEERSAIMDAMERVEGYKQGKTEVIRAATKTPEQVAAQQPESPKSGQPTQTAEAMPSGAAQAPAPALAGPQTPPPAGSPAPVQSAAPLPSAQAVPPGGTQATQSVVRRANQGATRNKDITPELESRVHEAVRAVYGEGASADLYSGGQDAKGKGNRRTGSTRHDDGKAGDFYIRDAQGKQIKGDDLGKIGQYWTAKGYGGVGMEMRGGGIHLDEHTDRAKAWGYADKGGRYSKAQKEAIARGMRGEMPELKMDPTLAALPGAPAPASAIPPGAMTTVAVAPAVATSPSAPPAPSAPAIAQAGSSPSIVEPVSGGRLGGGYGERKDDNTPVVGGVSQDVRDRRVAHIVTGGIGAAL